MSESRLGKGLEAIIRSKKDQIKDSLKNNDSDLTVEIDLDKITTNTNQPRKHFDPQSIKELTNSIEQKGLITPITVRKVLKNYEIVAGERRYRATKALGKKSILAHIIKVSQEVEMLELALIENLQRENLNAVEEAQAFKQLNTVYGMSQLQIAKSVSKSRVYVTNSIRLLKLPTKIIESLKNGDITAGHARAILQLKFPNLMISLWKKILKNSLSVRDSESLLKEYIFNGKKRTIKDRTDKQRQSKALKVIENKLIEILGTKVKINNSKEVGVIEINYFSEDDLERLIELFDSIES